MNLTITGENHYGGMSVAALLQELSLSFDDVVVSVNGKGVIDQYQELSIGDQVEIENKPAGHVGRWD